MATEMNMELIAEYRDINVQFDDWYEPIFDRYAERLRRAGFEAEDFQFSGFCNQGDGASFTGTVRNWARLLRAMGGYSPLRVHKVLVHYLQEDAEGDLCRISHHHSHENTVTFSIEEPHFSDIISALCPHNRSQERALRTIKDLFGMPDDDDLRAVAYALILHGYDLDALESDVQDYLRGIMQELYHDLEREYDYLTSDEVVWDTIVANELHIEDV